MELVQSVSLQQDKDIFCRSSERYLLVTKALFSACLNQAIVLECKEKEVTP